MNKIKQIALISIVTLAVSACGNTADRLANIGKAPNMSPIENPAVRPNYKSVTLPMPKKEAKNKAVNSIWGSDRQAFFKDQRAHRVGDILTVLIDINDEAALENETSKQRNSSENVGIPNILGVETQLSKILPEAVSPANLAKGTSKSNATGTGKIDRTEEIKLKLAAMISEVLPNGNFVIYGKQEVRVNFEVRELKIAGVIRPEDIATNNSISYDKIAEARITYGGRGQITDVQQPRYGQQAFDILFPF